MEALGAELVGQFLAEGRERGETVVVQLVGDLGAGKTTLARGMARGLGIKEPVTSPTFTVHKEYNYSSGSGSLHHFDFYRLEDLGVMGNELEELMREENNLILIEWGGILGELVKNAKIMKIEKLTDEKRVLLLE